MANGTGGGNEGFKGFARRALGVTFAFAIAVSLGVAMVQLALMRPLGGMVLAIFAFTAFLVLQRQGAMRRDLQTLKGSGAALDAYETDIDRRIEKLALAIERLEDRVVRASRQANRQTDDGGGGAELPPGEAARRIDRLERSVIGLTRRIADRETAPPPGTAVIGQVEDAVAVPPQDVAKGAEGSVATPMPAEMPAPMPDDGARAAGLSDADALALMLQPIVGLPDRKPAHFHATMRLRRADGRFYDDEAFADIVQAGAMAALVERKIVFASVRMLRVLDGQQGAAGLFCAVSPHLLADGRGFNDLAAFLDANRTYADRLAFVFSQRAVARMKVRERERLGRLADMGFSLALGDVQDASFDAEAMFARGFHHVTVQADMLLRGEMAGEGADPADLTRRLSQAGLNVVATEVEREEDVIALIDCDVRLARGTLFAPPRPVRTDLMDGPGRAAA